MTVVPAVTLDPLDVERAVERAYRDLVVEPTLAERFQRFIGELFTRIFFLVADRPVLGWILVTVIGVALLAFLVYALRRAGLVGEASLGDDRSTAPDIDWLAISREAEARGDLDGAVRAGFRALIAELAGRGWVPDRRSLTAREARAAVADRRAGLATAVADATTSFEAVAYARKTPDAQDVATLRRALEEVGR